MIRFISSLCVGISIVALLAGCNKPAEQPKQSPPAFTQGHPEGSTKSVAGVRWTVPGKWVVQAERQMRIATYSVPAVEGDPEDGECAVFFFGRGQGGDVEMNIDRWVNQFENAGKPDRSTKEVNGLKVTLVEVAGTYLAPAGPMMQSQGKKENYKLLGAIVEAPDGSVFFKLTGPAKTVAAAEPDFNSMIDSITKQ